MPSKYGQGTAALMQEPYRDINSEVCIKDILYIYNYIHHHILASPPFLCQKGTITCQQMNGILRF